MPFLEELLIILLAAGFGRVVSRMLGQPVILGEIIMGIVVSSFGLVHLTETLNHLAEIGVLILLFDAGLSMGLAELKRVGKSSTVVAVLGVIVPFGLGFLVARWFGYGLLPSLFVGGSLTATSVGIKTAILKDIGMLKSKIGSLIIGSAVVDDVLGLVVLTLLGSMSDLSSLFSNMSGVLFGILIAFGIVLPASLWGIRKVPGILLPREGNMILLAVTIILAFSLLTKSLELGEILGAFLAGLVFSESRFAKRLLEDMVTFGEGFFIPIFFVTIGFQFDLTAFAGVGGFAAAVVLVAIVSKILGCGLGARITSSNWRASLATGVAMIPRAEVALIIVKVGKEQGIIGTDVLSVILVMVIVTTFVTPPLLKTALKRARG